MSLELTGRRLTRDDLDELFEEYYPRLFNYLYYRTLNRAVSEDLVSQAMLNIVRRFESFDPERGNLDQWVFSITRNAFFSYLRQHKEETDIDAIPESIVAYEDDALETNMDEGQLVQSLLAQLTDEERELVFLKYWEELSNKEIASRLGMNASTVSTKLWRATEKMRAYLPKD